LKSSVIALPNRIFKDFKVIFKNNSLLLTLKTHQILCESIFICHTLHICGHHSILTIFQTNLSWPGLAQLAWKQNQVQSLNPKKIGSEEVSSSSSCNVYLIVILLK